MDYLKSLLTVNYFPSLPCREKFQNYLGDLEKSTKQLEEKNDQLVEELRGLSNITMVVVFFFFPHVLYIV